MTATTIICSEHDEATPAVVEYGTEEPLAAAADLQDVDEYGAEDPLAVVEGLHSADEGGAKDPLVAGTGV